MSVNNPGGGNPQSGRSVGQPGSETSVAFHRVFATIPHVVLTGWSKKVVWLVGVSLTGFVWSNSDSKAITIDWLADQE